MGSRAPSGRGSRRDLDEVTVTGYRKSLNAGARSKRLRLKPFDTIWLLKILRAFPD